MRTSAPRQVVASNPASAKKRLLIFSRRVAMRRNEAHTGGKKRKTSNPSKMKGKSTAGQTVGGTSSSNRHRA